MSSPQLQTPPLRVALNQYNTEITPRDPLSSLSLTRKIAHKLDAKPIGFIGSTAFPPESELHGSFLYALSDAYTFHRSLSFGPHDLWYVLLSEIARLVNASPDNYRHLFTKSPEKIEILVETPDATYLPMDLIIESLTRLVPVDLSVFLPQFSTHTGDSQIACMAAFADAVKSFYEYSTFMCGINTLEIRGTINDWLMFVIHVKELRKLFGVELDGWLYKIEQRAQLIAASLLGGDTDFYHSIFTTTGIGSGSELLVNGWFGKEFFREGGSKLPKIENFPNTWSIVPFKNVCTNRSFVDAFGCFYSTVQDGFRTPGYGRFTYEVPTT